MDTICDRMTPYKRGYEDEILMDYKADWMEVAQNRIEQDYIYKLGMDAVVWKFNSRTLFKVAKVTYRNYDCVKR